MPLDKLELYRAQILNALDHQNDSPSSIARRKILKLMYGSDSPYARTPTKDSVAAITVADLREFAATWERPDAAVRAGVKSLWGLCVQGMPGLGWAGLPVVTGRCGAPGRGSGCMTLGRALAA